MTRLWLTILAALALLAASWAYWLSRADPMLGVVQIASETGHGSGWAVGPHTVITNAHVVDGERMGMLRILTMLGGLGIVEDMWLSESSDLAVLTVYPEMPHVLPVVCEWPARGTVVRALGFPLMARWAAYQGRIASDLPWGKDRVVALDIGINRGMSGGPVVDSRGRVVAVTFAVAADGPFMSQTGLAVPGDEVCRALEAAEAKE